MVRNIPSRKPKKSLADPVSSRKNADPLSFYDLRIRTVTNKELIIVKNDLFYSEDHFTSAR